MDLLKAPVSSMKSKDNAFGVSEALECDLERETHSPITRPGKNKRIDAKKKSVTDSNRDHCFVIFYLYRQFILRYYFF